MIEFLRAPKYLPGYKYWTPRCRKHYKEETKVIDGVSWSREYETFGAYAKQKEVTSVNISINYKRQIEYTYRIRDVSPNYELGMSVQVYEEEIDGYATEAEALTEAKKWEELGEEYFGFKRPQK